MQNLFIKVGLIQIHGILNLIETLNSRIIWIFKHHLTTTELSTQWKEIAKLLPLKRIFQKIPILHSTENGTRSRWKPPTKNVKILCQSRLLLGFVVEKLDFFIHSEVAKLANSIFLFPMEWWVEYWWILFTLFFKVQK